MQTIYLLIWILYRAAGVICLFVFPFCYVLYTGKFRKGVFLTWSLWFLFLLINAIFLPAIARLYYLVYNLDPDFSPPEALLGGVLMIFVGWIPGLIISFFALTLRRGVLWLRRKKAGRSTKVGEELHK